MLAVDIDHTSLCVHEYGFQILGSQCLVVFFFFFWISSYAFLISFLLIIFWQGLLQRCCSGKH